MSAVVEMSINLAAILSIFVIPIKANIYLKVIEIETQTNLFLFRIVVLFEFMSHGVNGFALMAVSIYVLKVIQYYVILVRMKVYSVVKL